MQPPGPWDIEVDGDVYRIHLRRGPKWHDVAFVIVNPSEAHAVRAVRTLGDQIWVDEWTRGSRGSAPAPEDPDWKLQEPVEYSTVAEALVDHAREWPFADIRTFARALAAKGWSDARAALVNALALVQDANADAERWERRLCAVETEDPGAHEVALRLADSWTGSIDEFQNVVAEVAAPALLSPDASQPAL